MSLSEYESSGSNNPKAGMKMSQVDLELDRLTHQLKRLQEESEILAKRLERVCKAYISSEKSSKDDSSPTVPLAMQLKELSVVAHQSLDLIEMILDTLEL